MKKPKKFKTVSSIKKRDPDELIRDLVEEFIEKTQEGLNDDEAIKPQTVYDQFYWLAMFHYQVAEDSCIQKVVMATMLQGIATAMDDIFKYENNKDG